MQLILASSASKVTIERVSLHHITYIVSGEDFQNPKPDPNFLYMPLYHLKQIVLYRR
jgi:hypothetical protein